MDTTPKSIFTAYIKKFKHPYHHCNWVIIVKHEDGREVWHSIERYYQGIKQNFKSLNLSIGIEHFFESSYVSQFALRNCLSYYLKGEGKPPPEIW